MAQAIHAAVVGLHPKIPATRGEPSIDNFHYVDAPIAKVEGTRLFFATMAGVTLHANLYGRLLGNRNDAELPADTGGAIAFAISWARILASTREPIQPYKSRRERPTCQI